MVLQGKILAKNLYYQVEFTDTRKNIDEFSPYRTMFDIGTVLPVWVFMFWNCSTSVGLYVLELFYQCGTLCFGTFLPVWDFMFHICLSTVFSYETSQQSILHDVESPMIMTILHR
jgi:hypothetical protein